MRPVTVIWGALLLAVACARLEPACACADADFRSYDMTLTHTQEIIIDWLKQNRFEIYRLDSPDRQIQLNAENSADRLRIDLKPQSPLATQVRIGSLTSCAQPAAAALEMYLSSYMQFGEQLPAPVEQTIPGAVREQLKAVVCLHTDHAGARFQFSGFIVDPDGYIVCTAHDLNLHQIVRVVLFDGREFDGQVVRIDVARDLSLIKVEEPLAPAIPLRNGRFMLRPDDPLFAVTCPKSQHVVFQSGMLAGPPRRVGGFPLWQVNMHVDHGSSGSPVFDAQGCLAAVVKGRFRGTDSIGFLIPFETLIHFLEND